MELLIIGTLNGQIGAASKIAISKGGQVSLASSVEQALEILCSGKNVELIMVDVTLDVHKLISSLESRGYRNIYIIDNNSTYPPLLEYYNELPYNIFRLKSNLGYLALWKSGIYKKFKNQYYVYTDSDIIPQKDCPHDFLIYFYLLMDV